MKRFLLLLLFFAALVPAFAVAQNSPVTLSASIGFGGVVKVATWTNVTYTLANTGPDLQGDIQWIWDSGGAIYSQKVDLPHGAKKQIVLPVIDSAWSRGAKARFVATGIVRAEQRVSLDVLDPVQRLIVIVVDDQEAGLHLDPVVDAKLNRPADRLVRLLAADLPDRPELLTAITDLILDAGSPAFRPEQRRAALAWVAEGGHLYINGSRQGLATFAGVAAPAEIGAAATSVPLSELVPAADVSKGRDIPLHALVPRPGATVQKAGSGAVTRATLLYGQGSVTQMAWDLGSLQQSGAASMDWPQAIGIDAAQIKPVQPGNGQDVLRQAIHLPALRLASAGELSVLLLLYILLVGPVNFLVLRRIDRREYAYLTVPLAIVVFTAGAYLWGTASRGRATIVAELTIASGVSGATEGSSYSEVGIFTPTRRAYQVEFPADSLLALQDSFVRRVGDSGMTIQRTDTAVVVPRILGDVGQIQALTAARPYALPPIRVTGNSGAGGMLVVRNDSDGLLEDAVVVQGQASVLIGDVPPGGEKQVALPLNATGSGYQGAVRTTGPINRERALDAVINQSNMLGGGGVGPKQAPPPSVQTVPLTAAPEQPSSISVLGWLPTAGVPVSIDSQPQQVQGNTLMIIGAADAGTR